jgi:hypothetical protein
MRNSKKPSQAAERRAALEVAQEVAQRTAEATATTAMQNAATTAAQAVVKEFVSGPGLDQVVSATVTSVLKGLGVDTEHPEEMRKDLLALRDWRETRNMIRAKGIVTVTGIVVTFLFMSMVTGVVIALKKFGLY